MVQMEASTFLVPFTLMVVENFSLTGVLGIFTFLQSVNDIVVNNIPSTIPSILLALLSIYIAYEKVTSDSETEKYKADKKAEVQKEENDLNAQKFWAGEVKTLTQRLKEESEMRDEMRQEFQDKVEQLKQKVSEQDQKISRLRGEYETEVRLLKKQLEDTKEEKQRLINDLRQKERLLEKRDQQIQKRDDLIEQLRDKLAKRDTMIKDLRDELEKQNIRIDSLNEKVDVITGKGTNGSGSYGSELE